MQTACISRSYRIACSSLIDTPLIRGGKVGGGADPAAMRALVDAGWTAA
jgi:hypothetical protein